MSATSSPDWGDGSPRMPLRWGLCFAATLAVHVGAAWVALYWQRDLPADEPAPPAAVMIDLAPLPVAPAAEPNDVAPGVKQEVAQPPPPEPVEQPDLTPTELTTLDKVAVPLPPKLRPLKPQEHVVARELPKLQPVEDKPPVTATTAPPQVAAPAAAAVAAPVSASSSAPSNSGVSSWQGLLLGRLEQFKRYPNSARFARQQGVARLRFTMDRHGKVLFAVIEKTSGFTALDEETLALVRRAEPLPVPPPEVAGDPIELVVPVEFFLK